MTKTRHDCGWNDLAHGVNSWTGGSRWETSLQWALDMGKIAQEERVKAADPDYFDGVIDAVKELTTTGVIHRKGTP